MTNNNKYGIIKKITELSYEADMVMCVDIGNTDITLGGFCGREPSFVARVSTYPMLTVDEYAAKLLGVLSLYGVEKSEVSGAIISSVVPPLNSIIKSAIKLIHGVNALTVGPGIKTGVNIHCDTPSSVGSDLICACVAAQKLYGGPAIIVDMDTATKMTVIDGKGAFVGVSILPGVLMGLNSLSSETAQLPMVSLDAPASVVAKNTADCMRSGVIYGHASMVDGMIDRINSEIGEQLPIYVTGAQAKVIIPYCNHEMLLDDNLLLKGLNIIYGKNT